MQLKKFIHQYKGSSFPTLIETECGKNYILKMKGAGNGSISLLSEYIANKVAHRLGWTVPDVEWVFIEKDFPWTFGTDEFDDIVTKSFGWNLGIEYIADATFFCPNRIDFEDIILLNNIYSLDLFFINLDRSRSSTNFLRDPSSKIWLIDHGSLHLFHSNSTHTHTKLFSTHVLHEFYNEMNHECSQKLNDLNLFIDIIDSIPEIVLQESYFTKELLVKLFEKRIHQIFSSK